MTTPVSMNARPVTTLSAQARVAPAGTPPVKATSFVDRYFSSSVGGSVDMITMAGRVAVAGNTAIKGGAAAMPVVQGLWGALKTMDLSAMWSGVQALGKTAMTWGVRSAGIQGAVSLIGNGYRAMTGSESWGDAGTNVVCDTVSGAAGGAAGAIVGGVGTMLLTALGVAGGPLTLGAALIGMGGYFLGERLIKQTRLFQQFQGTVSTVMHDAFRPFSK